LRAAHGGAAIQYPIPFFWIASLTLAMTWIFHILLIFLCQNNGMPLDTAEQISGLFNKNSGADRKIYIQPEIQAYLGLTDAQILKATGFSNIIIADPTKTPSIGRYIAENEYKHMDPFIKQFQTSRYIIDSAEDTNKGKEAAYTLEDDPVKGVITLKSFPTPETADNYYSSLLKNGLTNIDPTDPAHDQFDLDGIPPKEFGRIVLYHEGSHIALKHSQELTKNNDHEQKLNTTAKLEGAADRRGTGLYQDEAPPAELETRKKAVEIYHDARAIGTLNAMISSPVFANHPTNIFFDPTSQDTISTFSGQETHVQDLTQSMFKLVSNATKTYQNNPIVKALDSLAFDSNTQNTYIMISALNQRGAFDTDPMATKTVTEYLKAMERRLPELTKGPLVDAKIAFIVNTLPAEACVLPQTPAPPPEQKVATNNDMTRKI